MRRILAASALVFAVLVTQAVAMPAPTPSEAIHFAGLERAYQCFPGAIRPGEKRPVYLSWKAASGGDTPKRDFVYLIYTSAAPGGENFSEPNWTTKGHLSFETPNLPPNRYFVVRARDRAGQHDRNTVELQAKSPCV